MTLDVTQEKAVLAITKLDHKIYVLTGGPGRGKTFTVKEILRRVWARGDISPMTTYIAAPTGKAARVLDEALSGVDSIIHSPSTIHRLYGCQGGGDWHFNRDNKLVADLVIIDESSMVDSELLARVIESTVDECRFILVGDKDQLPPVAAGAPFGDIVRHMDWAGIVHALGVNHRQAEGSLIANACDLVIKGGKPLFGQDGAHTLGGTRPDDLFFVERQDKHDIPGTVADIVRGWHEAGEDYCVLSPQHSGVCGVSEMNLFLQRKLNPRGAGKLFVKTRGGVEISANDKVLHTKNNYKLGVFNGYTGIVTSCSGESLCVDFDGTGKVVYDNREYINQLDLGYCVTIHKSQGSQYKYGVVVCHSSHMFMWSRQLLYTALSRFREKLYVVGNKKAINRAVRNCVEKSRNTLLDDELRKHKALHKSA